MGTNLWSDDWCARELFRVEGCLVDHYNRCLEKVTGARTALTSFSIDKRGESPEIETELGPNYLQNGPSHRYMIILSPEQRKLPLIHEEFCFDGHLIDFFYENCQPAIALATRLDGLYVELDDNVHELRDPRDLLLIRKISMEAHTPSGFLTKARELQKLVGQLQANPELLAADESRVVKKIFELVNEVGDVRNYNLTCTGQTMEVASFYTRFFDGVYVFRESGGRVVKAKRPSSPKWSRIIESVGQDAAAVIVHTYENDAVTTVILAANTPVPADGHSIRYLSLADTERVMSFLVAGGYAAFSRDLVDARVLRTEDEVLLSQGYPVARMSYEKRCRALSGLRSAMPPLWNELLSIKRELQLSGDPYERIIESRGCEVKAALLETVCMDTAARVVGSLLTKLYPYDYERMALCNVRDLERCFEAADSNKKEYIASLVKKQSSTLHR